MEKPEFSCSIKVQVSPAEAFSMISNVSEWWVKDVDGNTKALNDEFTVHFGETWKAFRVVEITPDNKIIWLVTDCYLPWNNDLKEWKNTRIVWDILKDGDSTQIKFTHVGLVDLDCSKQCENAWGGYIKKSLYEYISTGKGQPNKF